MQINEQDQKRVLMLVYGHVRDHPRVRREARAVAKLGYKVVVFGAARQGGFPTKETIDGFDIILMPVFTSFGLMPFLKMVLRLLRGDIGETTLDFPTDSHKIRSFSTLVFMNLWVLRFGFGQRFDLIHTHDIPIVPAAILLKWLYRAKAIHDAHENLQGMYRATFFSKLAVKLESFYMARADHVITVGERLKLALLERGAKHVTVIGNWRPLHGDPVDEERVLQARQNYQLDDYKLIVSYLGLFLPERSLLSLLQAVAQSPDVALLIGGRGPMENTINEYAEKKPNVIMLGWVPMEDVDFYTYLCDVVYYCIDPIVSHQAYYSTPNKLFESMIAGKGMIALKGVGEIGEVLEDVQSGMLLDEVKPESLLEAFEQLKQPEVLARLQQNALAHREQYTWEKAEQLLADMYSSILGANPENEMEEREVSI